MNDGQPNWTDSRSASGNVSLTTCTSSASFFPAEAQHGETRRIKVELKRRKCLDAYRTRDRRADSRLGRSVASEYTLICSLHVQGIIDSL